MDSANPKLNVIDGGFGRGMVGQPIITAEIPECPAPLTAAEQVVWDYVTNALKDYGLAHRTDGIVLSVIVKTYIQWLDAEQRLEKLVLERGSYTTTTANGYEMPHPMYYIARNFKKDLLTWLPEAALTIPSFAKIKSDEMGPEQGGLFQDPVETYRARKPGIPTG